MQKGSGPALPFHREASPEPFPFQPKGWFLFGVLLGALVVRFNRRIQFLHGGSVLFGLTGLTLVDQLPCEECCHQQRGYRAAAELPERGMPLGTKAMTISVPAAVKVM